jgi:hypothetical protein
MPSQSVLALTVFVAMIGLAALVIYEYVPH